MPFKPRTQLLLTGCLIVLGGLAMLGAAYYPGIIGQKQPIPFSHRVHAGKKEIGCLMCHSHAFDHAVAGIPPVQTCVLCHMRIIIHYPPIEQVRRHFKQDEPIKWVRVSDLPQLVHFNHSVHLAAGFGCGHCHGDVKQMDRIVLYKQFKMGFCIQCHREHDATHDCFACHY
jgi:hypothetical protein